LKTPRARSNTFGANNSARRKPMKKIALLFLLLPLLATGCHHGRLTELKGSGKRVVEKRSITPFTAIKTDGNFTIEVTAQKDLALEVEGDDNLLRIVTAEV